MGTIKARLKRLEVARPRDRGSAYVDDLPEEELSAHIAAYVRAMRAILEINPAHACRAILGEVGHAWD